jgi:dienelactone hydrolase
MAGSTRVSDPRLIVDATPTLIDEAPLVRVERLRAGERVDLTIRARDTEDIAFVSRCTFEADDGGVVDVAAHAPVIGDYGGVDRFGPWWSLRTDTGDGFSLGMQPIHAEITLLRDGVVMATSPVQRRTMGGGVRMERVRDGLVVGALFVPARHPAPGVIVVGGSGGGLHWSATIAALLASRGFSALACAYFGAAGLPPSLNDIPLEAIGAAMRWLLDRDEVDGDAVGLVGRSRGGELALQAAAMYPDAGAVVGFAASGVRWTGFDPASSRPRPAWTWRGDALPYLVPDPEAVEDAWLQSPVVLRDAFTRALVDVDGVQQATINVEDICGPILLVSGSDDQLWPAAALSAIAMERGRLRASAAADRHLLFAGAGHSVGEPPGLPLHDVTRLHPVDRDTYLLGGTRARNAASGAEAWPLAVEFLATHLASARVHRAPVR